LRLHDARTVSQSKKVPQSRREGGSSSPAEQGSPATSRGLVAVLENDQRPDGGIDVPKMLQPFLGRQTVIRGPSER